MTMSEKPCVTAGNSTTKHCCSGRLSLKQAADIQTSILDAAEVPFLKGGFSATVVLELLRQASLGLRSFDIVEPRQ